MAEQASASGETGVVAVSQTDPECRTGCCQQVEFARWIWTTVAPRHSGSKRYIISRVHTELLCAAWPYCFGPARSSRSRAFAIRALCRRTLRPVLRHSAPTVRLATD